MNEKIINKLAIIGCGHIGASIALAAKDSGSIGLIAVGDKNPKHLHQAKKLRLADSFHLMPQNCHDCVKDAEIIIIATHLASYSEIAHSIAPSLKKNAIVSDIGSCKAGILETLENILPKHCSIIPAHPVAGTEKSGPSAGLKNMFRERHTIICPPLNCDKKQLNKLVKFWQSLGAHTDLMNAEEHDSLLALTSHLPHLIAYALVGSSSGIPISTTSNKKLHPERFNTKELARFSAGGFRDMTRIADSNPDMWIDIVIHNRARLLNELAIFSEDLHILTKALRWNDKKFLKNWFTKTRKIRQHVVKFHQAGIYLATEKTQNTKKTNSKI